MSNLDDAARTAYHLWHAKLPPDAWLTIETTFKAGYREAIADLRLTKDDLRELRRQSVFDDLADRIERVVPQ